jgi:hypothetical protein
MQDKQALQEDVKRTGLMDYILDNLQDKDLFWLLALPCVLWPVYLFVRSVTKCKGKNEE